MGCPYLEFRDAVGERRFERERPYCGAAEAFVQPMRADICSKRYDLTPADHCELFRAHEGLE